jgi:hypothetical protein
LGGALVPTRCCVCRHQHRPKDAGFRATATRIAVRRRALPRYCSTALARSRASRNSSIRRPEWTTDESQGPGTPFFGGRIGRGWLSEGLRLAPVASGSAGRWSAGTIRPVFGCAGSAPAAASVLVVGLVGCRLRGGRESMTCQSADVRGSWSAARRCPSRASVMRAPVSRSRPSLSPPPAWASQAWPLASPRPSACRRPRPGGRARARRCASARGWRRGRCWCP